ncbi:MAG: NTP transferase domain-containing protein [Gloeobacteraceae cyanobacterium ES-bin-144]|nr:NTP transferase domain-containing protein [Verrucomicrobiales bacterium]
MKVSKAVITAAGKSQRTLPLQTLVDRDGNSKSALAILAEEISAAGIEEIAVVICPGDEAAYAAAAGHHAVNMRFIEQPEALGYAHAVHCAAPFTGSDPFLLMVGDHLYLSRSKDSCAAQLLATAAAENCIVSAVQATHESKLPLYGAVGGRRVGGSDHLYQIETVIEKPTPTEAEQKLVVPGLRAGNYLCFFGLHVLSPLVMEIIASQLKSGRADLSGALSEIARRERYLAHQLQGRRHDIGVRYGLLTAQLALGLAGKDRDEVLTNIVELLAQSHD